MSTQERRHEHTLVRLLRLIAPYRRWVALAVLLSFLTIGSSVALMAMSSYLISRSALVTDVVEVAIPITLVRVFAILRAVFRYLERLFTHRATFRILTHLRVWFYAAVEPLAPARLQAYRSGDLLARIVGDIETLENFYVRVVVPPLSAALVTMFACLILGLFDAVLAVALLLFLALTGVVLPLAMRWLSRQPAAALVGARAELNATLVDQIQGLADVLSFDQAGRYEQRLLALSGELEALQGRMAMVRGLSNGLAVLLTSLAGITVLGLAIPLVSGGQIDGVYLALLPLTAIAAFEAVQPLSLALQQLESNRAAARRLFEIIDVDGATPPPAPPLARGGESSYVPGSLRAKERPADSQVGMLAPQPAIVSERGESSEPSAAPAQPAAAGGGESSEPSAAPAQPAAAGRGESSEPSAAPAQPAAAGRGESSAPSAAPALTAAAGGGESSAPSAAPALTAAAGGGESSAPSAAPALPAAVVGVPHIGVLGAAPPPPEPTLESYPPPPGLGEGSGVGVGIELRDVTFRYAPSDAPALQGVSLRVPAGSRAVIAGPSGSGKSTIVNLLLRFWDCPEGEIRIGGRDLRGMDGDEAQRLFTVAPQTVHLFGATIADNLHLANPDATPEQMAAACAMAQLHDFVTGLPQGYDTLIGENGLLLSGGERQRLALARAILKDAPIVILDEATANLDALTEQRLLQSIEPWLQGRTVLIIAHRPGKWPNIDQVIELENGRRVG